MSASILERIESHQLRIIAGQDEIVATVRGLVGRVDDHENRIVELEASAGTTAGVGRLLAVEQRQARQERRMRLLLWIFPAACVASAAAGAWAALHL